MEEHGIALSVLFLDFLFGGLLACLEFAGCLSVLVTEVLVGYGY